MKAIIDIPDTKGYTKLNTDESRTSFNSDPIIEEEGSEIAKKKKLRAISDVESHSSISKGKLLCE